MAQRTDMIKALQNLAMSVTMEATDAFYKSISLVYPKLVTLRKVSEIKGTHYQTSSVVGIQELEEVEEGEPIPFRDPVEGYQIYLKKKKLAVGTEFTLELDQDFEQIKDFFRAYIRENIPPAVVEAKEKAIAGLFNEGAFTAGSTKFNNATKTFAPSYGNFAYDTKPFLNLSGNNRSAKGHNTTYYNHIGSLALTFDNLSTAHNLLTDTNAKKENGQPFDNTQNKKLLVPTGLVLTARRIINSELIPGNSNNDKNALQGEYDIVQSPYITTATAWAIGRPQGILFFDSNDVIYEFWKVNETQQLRCSAHIRVAYGVRNWRAWVGSNFPTS